MYETRKPRAVWIGEDWHDDAMSTTLTVHEEEQETFTGLLDANGNEIHRMREPMGFCI